MISLIMLYASVLGLVISMVSMVGGHIVNSDPDISGGARAISALTMGVGALGIGISLIFIGANL